MQVRIRRLHCSHENLEFRGFNTKGAKVFACLDCGRIFVTGFFENPIDGALRERYYAEC